LKDFENLKKEELLNKYEGNMSGGRKECSQAIDDTIEKLRKSILNSISNDPRKKRGSVKKASKGIFLFLSNVLGHWTKDEVF